MNTCGFCLEPCGSDREMHESCEREVEHLRAEAEWEHSPEGQAELQREADLRREYPPERSWTPVRDDHPSLTARERSPGLV